VETAFGETVATWRDFYAVTGAAAATLAGLLFVAVSLNVDRFRAQEASAAGRLAAQAFGNFVSVLLIALVFLVPNLTPEGLGWPVTIMALVALVELGRRYLGHRRAGRAGPGRRPAAAGGRLVGALAVPGLSYLTLLGVGVTVLTGSTDWLGWLVPVNLVLLGNAAASAWQLLVAPPEEPA
jgi:hypothetical protein